MKPQQRTNLILAVALVAGLLAWYLLSKRGNTTLGAGSDHFAIADTASIRRITLRQVVSGADYRTTTLTRTPTGWLVNDSLTSNPENVQMLLNTLYGMRIREKPAPQATKTFEDELKRDYVAVTAELADGGDYEIAVAGPSSDMRATRMRRKGDSQHYVVHIPGFQGDLGVRFSTMARDWRSYVLYAAPPAQVKELRLTWHGKPDSSFALRQTQPGKWELEGGAVADTFFVHRYLKDALGTHMASSDVGETMPRKIDSLMAVTPEATLQLTMSNGQQQTVRLWNLPEDNYYYLSLLLPQRRLYLTQAPQIQPVLVKRQLFGLRVPAGPAKH